MAVVGGMVISTVLTLFPGMFPGPLGLSLAGKALEEVKHFWASHIKAATWARVMDGRADGGPVWEYLIRPLNEAATREAVMKERAGKALRAAPAREPDGNAALDWWINFDPKKSPWVATVAPVLSIGARRDARADFSER